MSYKIMKEEARLLCKFSSNGEALQKLTEEKSRVDSKDKCHFPSGLSQAL